MTVRLATVAQDLVDAISKREPAKQRAAASAVSEWIIDEVSLVNPKVDAALAALREGRVGDSHERNALKVLVDALDERAWDIQDEVEAGRASEQQYLDGFAQARAASAVWFALDADPLAAVLEATYEAQAARGDLDGARRRIHDAVA